MYLLDTNVISELRKIKPHGAVMLGFALWAATIYSFPQWSSAKCRQALSGPAYKLPKRQTEIERFIDRVLSSYAVLPSDAVDLSRVGTAHSWQIARFD